MPTYRVVGFLAMAILYFAIPNPRPDFTHYNCNDSECYLTLSWNLSHGRGYTRSMVDNLYLPHTTWPPGVPVLMIPATLLSGDTINWYLVKWTMCLIGLAGVLFAWLYVRSITGNSYIADVSALLLGLSPIFWDFSHQAMAEAPLTTWVIGGLYLVDRIWAKRKPRIHEALMAGLICGLGMMFKGHAGGLVFAPLVYLLGSRRSVGSSWRICAMWVVFAISFSIPQLSWMVRNLAVPATGFEGINRFRSILAVDPNNAQSALVTGNEFAIRVVNNIRYHTIYRLPEQMIPGLWPLNTFHRQGGPIIALILSVLIILASFPRRWESLLPCVVAAPMIVLNLAYSFGGSSRFWLPITALLTLSIIINFNTRLSSWRHIRMLPLICALPLIVNVAIYVAHHEAHPYHRVGAWKEFAELIEVVADDKTIPRGRVLTQNSDAFQLMTGWDSPWGVDDISYEYLVVDSQKEALPEGSIVIISRSPWVFAALPKPMSRIQIAEAVARGK